MDPDGLFLDYYGQAHDAQQIVNSLLMNKKKYENIKKADEDDGGSGVLSIFDKKNKEAV